jgi:phosphoserine phosphatase
MGPTFKRYYAWVLAGTPLNRLDGVAKRLACKITDTDRASIRRLYDEGHALMIISCGTLDLIERILEIAGIKAYFNPIEGNRLQCSRGRIRGIEKRLIFPSDKLKPVKALGVDRMRTVAVGDGYTDIPLLDWSAFPVLMDRSKTFKKNPKASRYTPVASITELSAVIGRLSIETGSARGLGPEK